MRTLLVLGIAIGMSGCKKYTNYSTLIKVLNDASGDILYLAHKDGDTYPLGVLSMGAMVGTPGDTFTYVMYWDDDYDEDLSPRTTDLFIFRAEYTGGIGYGYTSTAATDGFRLLPSRVYFWDGTSNKVEDTGERTEKIEKSGCGALPGTYTLQTVNGNILPYSEAGSTAQITGGSITFNSGNTWTNTLYVFNTATGQNVGPVVRSGTYTCTGSSGSTTNQDGITGPFSFDGGTVTLTTGSTVLVYR